MAVVTRFAPSPTGYLHLGGARTALFNWLYARHEGGSFRLRIEDTDRARSTEDAVRAILDGLNWLGLDWDGPTVHQFEGAAHHAACARRLLEAGKAYYCYCSPEELKIMRETARAEGRQPRYDGRWRDRDPAEAPAGIDPVVRFKAPQEGETILDDRVQGTIRVTNSELDDMVLLRADGTPTYMLSVVIDDHDMGVTHAIRGDDHLTNAIRQTQLFRAFGWDAPLYAHIPLIHGSDGAKLSKRHGAVAVEAYRDEGILPEAMRNYLLRLGWSHGDDEIISSEQAIAWFTLENVGRSAARFDPQKLKNLNGHYIREGDDQRLADLVEPIVRASLAPDQESGAANGRAILATLMPQLKERAKTLHELAENIQFAFRPRPLTLNEKAAKLVNDESVPHLREIFAILGTMGENWTAPELESCIKSYADSHDVKLGKIAQPLRAVLTGTTISPPIFDVMAALGFQETTGRIADAVGQV